ncbi:MAG: transposase [Richelia sp.]|nr:transposase [Richelia sp.]
MFKMLVLQQLYNISDEELEYQVNNPYLQIFVWQNICR